MRTAPSHTRGPPHCHRSSPDFLDWDPVQVYYNPTVRPTSQGCSLIKRDKSEKFLFLLSESFLRNVKWSVTNWSISGTNQWCRCMDSGPGSTSRQDEILSEMRHGLVQTNYRMSVKITWTMFPHTILSAKKQDNSHRPTVQQTFSDKRV